MSRSENWSDARRPRSYEVLVDAVRDHPTYTLLVAFAQRQHAVELALHAHILLSAVMTLALLGAHNQASTGYFEPLLGTLMRLQLLLGHLNFHSSPQLLEVLRTWQSRYPRVRRSNH